MGEAHAQPGEAAREPGLDGVTVLLELNGQVVDTATTDGDGRFLFSGFAPNEAGYVMRIDLGQPALNGLVPTVSDAWNDVADSDAVLDGNSVTVDVAAGAPGVKDFTRDVGFTATLN